MRNGTILSLSLLLIGGTALAAPEFEEIDTDDNGTISRLEFRTAVEDHDIYTARDHDQSGWLDENELRDSMDADTEADFKAWDVDESGNLDSNEFYDGFFSRYDDDEDGHWDGDEWDDAGDEGFWDV